MKFLSWIVIPLLLITMNIHAQSANESDDKYLLVIHGGAGNMQRGKMSTEKEAEYRAKLTEALQTGYQNIKDGKSSIDAVVATIQVMEESPLFNAGKGAVLTHEGKNELDASIMDGKSRMAGAVSGITTIKSPIEAARMVMDKSEHVMLSGKGAEEFATNMGLSVVSPDYFWTERRSNSLKKRIKKDADKVALDYDDKQASVPAIVNSDDKFGTVGAVARDLKGNLAAGTSTGGMNNKKFGRIGDSPIIGAGNYANDQVAISCTGWGEYYIRTVAAYNIASQMKLLNRSVTEAAQNAMDEIGELGGHGGIIAIDKDGRFCTPFNTKGMYRGTVNENGEIEVLIF